MKLVCRTLCLLFLFLIIVCLSLTAAASDPSHALETLQNTDDHHTLETQDSLERSPTCTADQTDCPPQEDSNKESLQLQQALEEQSASIGDGVAGGDGHLKEGKGLPQVKQNLESDTSALTNGLESVVAASRSHSPEEEVKSSLPESHKAPSSGGKAPPEGNKDSLQTHNSHEQSDSHVNEEEGERQKQLGNNKQEALKPSQEAAPGEASSVQESGLHENGKPLSDLTSQSQTESTDSQNTENTNTTTSGTAEGQEPSTGTTPNTGDTSHSTSATADAQNNPADNGTNVAANTAESETTRNEQSTTTTTTTTTTLPPETTNNKKGDADSSSSISSSVWVRVPLLIVVTLACILVC
ncbi:uncharacterized protein TM35_000671080 [Trypanosoma theileri]|uniref:Mucin-associated surface protein (MASP) n=1 Tax=Trypanosoma theileri TaxID=67003 RepID=A0A1X0NFJ8_9TRYP|nr:uncharacterized protein TM35_000671080 [Trypanosoma theileri]ORC83502.1 hypothetical protein TM35_000671080 [Trypanosoma theileri]